MVRIAVSGFLGSAQYSISRASCQKLLLPKAKHQPSLAVKEFALHRGSSLVFASGWSGPDKISNSEIPHDEHICGNRMCPMKCELCNRMCSSDDHLHPFQQDAVHLCGYLFSFSNPIQKCLTSLSKGGSCMSSIVCRRWHLRDRHSPSVH